MDIFHQQSVMIINALKNTFKFFSAAQISCVTVDHF